MLKISSLRGDSQNPSGKQTVVCTSSSDARGGKCSLDRTQAASVKLHFVSVSFRRPIAVDHIFRLLSGRLHKPLANIEGQ